MTCSLLVLSVILSFAAKSYKLEKVRGEKTRLYFLAMSGLNLTVDNILAFDEKEFTTLSDIKGAGQERSVEACRIKTTVEDENAKLNVQELKKNNGPDIFSFAEAGSFMAEVLRDSGDMEGMDARWKPFVTRFGNGGINVNTAPAEILMIFFEKKNDAMFFAGEREEKPLKNISELSYLRQESFRKELPLKNLPFTVKSDCFTIYSEASSPAGSVSVRAVYRVHDKKAERIYLEKNE
jgi:type II secretory pathway component PulK